MEIMTLPGSMLSLRVLSYIMKDIFKYDLVGVMVNSRDKSSSPELSPV